MKLRTLFTMDYRWAYRFLKKRVTHRLKFVKTRLTGRKYWEVSLEGVTVRAGFLTPYHQSMAQGLSEGGHEIETRTLWTQECKKPHSIIYDIGGFTGIYGLLAAKANPTAQVTIFEPDPTNFANIQHNIKINDLKNCIARQAAVTDYSGKINF